MYSVSFYSAKQKNGHGIVVELKSSCYKVGRIYEHLPQDTLSENEGNFKSLWNELFLRTVTSLLPGSMKMSVCSLNKF